jgi:hypothetical protein
MVDSADVMDNEEGNKREYANKAYSLLLFSGCRENRRPRDNTSFKNGHSGSS